MRVQHNIAAMNSYRNYGNNTKSINKNLEKLSSGYKINRAGDDAAGLAISEKMRAQITGLSGAQKNAKDGISLVQTAEGALTEVHSMLNRMYDLAEQSANGTFEGLDRAQLQKEVDQLREEINRVADSSNFNGINLLDGSLSASGSSGAANKVTADLSKLSVDVLTNYEEYKNVKGKYTTSKNLITTATAASTASSVSGLAKGDRFEFSINYTDSEGNEKTSTITLKVADVTQTSTTARQKYMFVIEETNPDNTKVEKSFTTTAALASATKVTASAMGQLIVDAITNQPGAEIKANFTVTNSGGQLTFESKAGGSEGAVLNDYTLKKIPKATDLVEDSTNNDAVTVYSHGVQKTVSARDAGKGYDFTKAYVWDNAEQATISATRAQKNLEDAIFEVNGQKFVFVAATLTRENIEELNAAGVGNNWVKVGAYAATDTKIGEMALKMKEATGLDIAVGSISSNVLTTTALKSWEATGGKYVVFRDGGTTSKGKAGGLTLQIGDTAASYNQLNVDIKDVHVKSLKIHDIDISQQGKAQEAMDKLKSAINDVSAIRGTLGATQNRLEHTMNNLSVMQENIQDAESTIRDTDVADEMMKYTKNSILVQSAQAMLAQANQQPQGVLQLLQ